MGSGTTNKIAKMLKRNSIGYEIVKEKMGLEERHLFEKDYEVEMIIRNDVRHLRRYLQSIYPEYFYISSFQT
jgi:DNA modification methylase